jgi:Domain of unknown function (DUF202)
MPTDGPERRDPHDARDQGDVHGPQQASGAQAGDPRHMDPEEPDPGLAADRTRLAWARTAIAFAAVGGLALRNDVIIGLVTLAATPLVWVLGALASRETLPEQRSARLLLVTVTVSVVALLAVVGALLGHSPASLRDVLPLHG